MFEMLNDLKFENSRKSEHINDLERQIAVNGMKSDQQPDELSLKSSMIILAKKMKFISIV